MPEVLPGEASESVEGQDEDALPGLRLSRPPPRLLPALLLAAASGALLSFALPPVGAGWIAFLAPVPFLMVVRSCRPRRGALLGLAFGVAYFGLVLYWILLFGELAWGALVLLSTGFVAVFGLLAPALWRSEHPVRSVLGLAALWTVIEYVRGAWPLGGFGWGELGTTQTGNRFLLPLASVTGVWGISFAAVLVAGLLGLALERRRGRPASALVLVGVCVALILAPALIPLPAATGRGIDVAAIQVDVRRADGLPPAPHDLAVVRMVTGLHRRLEADPPDLAVWGEGTLQPSVLVDPVAIASVEDAIQTVGAPTVAGGVVNDPDGRQRTSVLVFDGRGQVVDRYDKVKLVPFGEYVPFRRWLGWVPGIDQVPIDRAPGAGPHTVSAPGLPAFGTPICYENSFPSIERVMVRDGATFFVLTTNDSSYDETAASRQHLLMSQLRAVETGRWIVHAAISGITGIVNPRGDVVAERGLFDPGITRHTIRASSAATLYVRFGDWLVWACLALTLGLFLVPRRRQAPDRPLLPLDADPRILVVLPTYDERATIEAMLEGLLALSEQVDVLVVDDSSPDRTAEVVRARAEREPRLRLIERPARSGLASAYRVGFDRGLAERYDLVVEMDSDLSHDPRELPDLLAAARHSHLVIGSRYVPGGSVTNWSRARLALSRGGNAYASFWLGFPLHDATSGFRVYRRELLARLQERPTRSDGYGFQIELAYQAWRAGYIVAETPITFRERQHGASKISRRIVVEALWLVSLWGLRARIRHD